MTKPEVTPAINLAQSHILITDRPHLTEGERVYFEYIAWRFGDELPMTRYAQYILSGVMNPADSELRDFMVDVYEAAGSTDPAGVLFYLEQISCLDASDEPWPED